MISFAPRLAPSIIRRPRLEEWLGRFRRVPVRFLVGPPGFGKTTALVSYLRHCDSNGLYCALGVGANAADLWAAVAKALEARAPFTSHAEVIRALVECAPSDLAIDCDDVPDAEGIAAIAHLIDDVPEDISLLIACRSRAALNVGRYVSRGMASLCDAERLAFDAEGIRHLAEAWGVPFAHADVVRLLEVTDGWPQVVSSAIRKAAEDGCNLSEAFENWRTRHGHLFSEFVTSMLEHTPEREASLVRKLMNGSYFDDQQQLQALEAEGLFVIHTPDGYRPLRAVTRTRVHTRAIRRAHSALPMQVRMLGWFQAEIDRHPIEWVRRRDQQIFKYVALKRGGTVSRSEIGRVFWPDAEKHLIAQSLRTACCNIRKAIAKIVGFDEVDAYFRTSGDISINLDNVVVDVNRFIAHANDGDQQFERRELRAAYAHYRSAERLYWGSLLTGDANEPWVSSQAAALEDRHIMILERLSELAVELDDYGAGVTYARRVGELKPESETARSVLEKIGQDIRQNNVIVATRRDEVRGGSSARLATTL